MTKEAIRPESELTISDARSTYRVLYINHTIYKSGAAISLGTLIKNLPENIKPYFVLRAGNEVEEIIGAVGHPKYYERWMPQFMVPVAVPQYNLLLYLWHIVKIPIALCTIFSLVQKWKIQLIHINESTLLPYAFISRLIGIPVVMHARCTIAKRPIEQFWLKMISFLDQTAIIAIDDETKNSFPEVCKNKIFVIYNPIDIEKEPSPREVHMMRESWGCLPSDIVIGQVASLHTSKGIWEILDFASELCPKYPQLKFVLVGDDREGVGEGHELRKFIARKGLEKQVLLPGYLKDLSTVYAALDIAFCLFSSRLGGVGRAAYEAALAGKPLIATLPDPNSSKTIRNGITGLVFKPDDKAGMLETLRVLIESKEQRVEFGERARNKIGSRHLPSAIALQVEHIYASLLRNDNSIGKA